MFVVRFAQWDSGKDRESCQADNAHQLSLSVKHCVYPEDILANIHLQEQRLAACVTATLTEESIVRHQPAIVYHWDFPGTVVRQTLQWTSSSRTQELERCWQDTVPKDADLEVYANLIERFGIETFNDYIDVMPEQLSTVHHNL